MRILLILLKLWGALFFFIVGLFFLSWGFLGWAMAISYKNNDPFILWFLLIGAFSAIGIAGWTVSLRFILATFLDNEKMERVMKISIRWIVAGSILGLTSALAMILFKDHL